MAASFREKALEASFKKYKSEFETGKGKFVEMGRVQPLSRKQYENFFNEKWGSSSEAGPIWKQVIGEFSTGEVNKAMKRSYESYRRLRSSQEEKGYTFENPDPLSPSEFYVEYKAMSEAGVKNKAREQVYAERTFSSRTAKKISKFVKEKGAEAKKAIRKAEESGEELDEELMSEYESAIDLAQKLKGKNLAKEDRPRGEMYKEVAAILGYQAAEEYIYPEQAATRRRSIESPIIFTRDEQGRILDSNGNIVGRV